VVFASGQAVGVKDPSNLFPNRGAPKVPGQTTLSDLFPGNMGRLQFVRVMLRLFHPGLDEFPWDEPLPAELLEKISSAIEDDERG
jgi:hypothetical protein